MAMVLSKIKDPPCIPTYYRYMPKLLFFRTSSEADLCARSRPPHGAPDPKTSSARSPRALAVTPPPRPAPPPRATPRGPPLKLAFFQNLPDFAFFS